jgi:hypothetical protein
MYASDVIKQGVADFLQIPELKNERESAKKKECKK